MREKFITYIYVISRKFQAKPRHTQVLWCGIGSAALIGLLSLPFLGFDPAFLYGLALGTAIGAGNHQLLAMFAGQTVERRRGVAIAVLGYAVRLAIYAAAFLVAYRSGAASGIACLLGFLAMKLGLVIVYGILPGFHRQRPTDAPGKKRMVVRKPPALRRRDGEE